MRITKIEYMLYCIDLDDKEPPRAGHRPAVDVLFEDNSQFNDFDKIAVIMTGMGSDGAIGLKTLKSKGNVIAIAESANTCIVYGMPKAAVETNLVNEVVDVDNIAKTIINIYLKGVLLMDTNQYLEMFIEESKEHLQACNEHLLELEKNPKI